MVIRSLMAKVAFSYNENCGIVLPADGNFRLIVEWRAGGVPMTKKTKIKAQKKAEEDANLDEALAETFPASDPLSMTQPRTGADVPQRRPRRHPKGEVPPRKITNHQ
jgi:hypothetical protein